MLLYTVGMRGTKAVSVTLPPELLLEAEARARREHRSMSELLREALRRYLTTNAEWDALLRRTRRTGRALGIRSEADVERLSDDFRRKRRQRKTG